MVRKRTLDTFDRCAEQARSSLVASFANGILQDKAAVIAAITRPWSNGQTRRHRPEFTVRGRVDLDRQGAVSSFCDHVFLQV
jgi:hypothetical protein